MIYKFTDVFTIIFFFFWFFFVSCPQLHYFPLLIGINRIVDCICSFPYSQLISPTPEEEMTSESESNSNTTTNGRQLHAIDTTATQFPQFLNDQNGEIHENLSMALLPFDGWRW